MSKAAKPSGNIKAAKFTKLNRRIIMTRLGDEMILELAASLNASMNKTAAKKDKEEKKEECEECGEEKCKCKEEKKDEKKDDKKGKKKDAAVMNILSGLSKLAGDLDEASADEASSLVDDALKIIVNKIKEEQSE